MAVQVRDRVQHVVGWVRANGTPERLPYLWLALGMLLFAFEMPRWALPLAAWLYPVFFLRFARTQPLRRGMLLLLLASALVTAFGLRGVIPFPPVFFALEVVIGAVATTLPYLLDRVLARRLGGLLGTLVFPFAATSVSYVFAALNPSSGTFGNVAYTQYGDLPLLQLLSVTGLWGVDFVMAWLAAVVNWAWERDFAWPRVRGGLALYGGLLALVLLFGGARLAIVPAQGRTVRIAGIGPSQALVAAADRQMSRAMGGGMMMGTATPSQRAALRQASAPVFDEMLALSQQEASAGAKIIVWPECSGSVTLLQEDEAGLLARASTLARSTHTYLDLGLCVMLAHPTPSRSVYDETILIDPSGRVLWTYQKAHPVPGEPFPPGDGKVPSVATPYGRLANVICFDADFPATLRQAGQAGAAVLLVPGNDWREIDPYHTRMATYRAIENGYSLVRQASNGLALTVDYEGNALGAADYYTSDPQVMLANVPMSGVHTVYAAVGDLFAWMSLAGLAVLIGVVIARARGAGRSPAGSQGTRPRTRSAVPARPGQP